MFIFLLSLNKKKKITQYLSLPLCLFFDYPQTRKKKKRVLEPGRLEYCVNGTQVYQARVPQKFF